MVIRVVSVPDDTELTDLHEMFQVLLDWNRDLGDTVRMHGQELNNFRRKTRSQPLRMIQLHRHEMFRYIADTLSLWEKEIRMLDADAGTPEDRQPRCLAGRGAAPPEGGGGPRGYRLMLKRQQEGAWVSAPALVDATVQWLAATHPEQPAKTRDLLRDVIRDDGSYRTLPLSGHGYLASREELLPPLPGAAAALRGPVDRRWAHA